MLPRQNVWRMRIMRRSRANRRPLSLGNTAIAGRLRSGQQQQAQEDQFDQRQINRGNNDESDSLPEEAALPLVHSQSPGGEFVRGNSNQAGTAA